MKYPKRAVLVVIQIDEFYRLYGSTKQVSVGIESVYWLHYCVNKLTRTTYSELITQARFLRIEVHTHRDNTQFHEVPRRATRTARTTPQRRNRECKSAFSYGRSLKTPFDTQSYTQLSIPTRLTAPTLSTRAKTLTEDAQLEDPAQGKHKRPTLSEVTVNNPKGRGAVTEKGKAKDDAAQAVPVPPSKFAGVIMKNKPVAATAIPQSRQVLRSIAASSSPL